MVVLVAILLAGCAAKAAPAPEAPPQGDVVTAVAFRVEPTLTDVTREGMLAWSGCQSAQGEPCGVAPERFGDNEWRIVVQDDEAVFWRLNLSLEWLEASPRNLHLDLYAVHGDGCPNGATSCSSARSIEGAAGNGRLSLVREYFLNPGETAIELVVTPASYNPYALEEMGKRARLEGWIAPYHPVSGPIAVNATAA